MMPDLSATRMLDALSALDQLQPESCDFFTEVTRVLSQALEYPWVAVIRQGDTTAEPEGALAPALALHMGKDDTAENRTAITAAARQALNTMGGDGQWTGSITVDGLGALEAHVKPCRDSEGSVHGHLLALAPGSPQLSDQADNMARFAKTFMALAAQRVGTQLGRQHNNQILQHSADNFRDITALKMSQLELAEKSAVLETILQAAPFAITLRDTQGRFVFINKLGAELVGLEPADFLGKTRTEVFGAGNNQHIEESAMQVLRCGNAIFDVEGESHWISGRIFSISFTPVRDSDGQLSGVVGISQDISDRKRVENALRENERALTEAQRIGMMGHWRIYPDSDMIEYSNQAGQNLGFPEGEGLRNLTEMRATVPAEDLKKIAEARAAGLANREAYGFKYRIIRPDGALRVMQGPNTTRPAPCAPYLA
jgi:PAS domain S-box-containing protein